MREGIEPLPYNYKYIRPWRSWITQQIPILKNGGSNPLGRAKKSKSSDLDFFIHCESNGISSAVRLYIINNGVPLLYLITPLGVYQQFFRNDDIQDFVLMICNFLRN